MFTRAMNFFKDCMSLKKLILEHFFTRVMDGGMEKKKGVCSTRIGEWARWVVLVGFIPKPGNINVALVGVGHKVILTWVGSRFLTNFK